MSSVKLYGSIMDKPLRQKVLDEIDAFLRGSGMSKTRFGLESVGNDKIIDQMRAGKNPRADTIDAIRLYMRTQREAKKKAREELRAQSSAA